MHVNCELLGWKKVKLKIVAGSDKHYFKIKELLQKRLVYFEYDKKYSSFVTSLNEFYRLQDACDELNIDIRASHKFARALDRHDYELERFKKAKKNKNFQCNIWRKDKNVQPYDYQKTTINYAVEKRRILLGDDMGVGKTPQATGIICKSFETYGYEKALIVCPVSLMYQWKEEIIKFTKMDPNKIHVIDQHICPTGEAESFNGRLTVCRGSKAQGIPQCENYDECAKSRNQNVYRLHQIKYASVLIINYDKLDKYQNDIIRNEYNVFIFDEAKEIKNPKAAKTKAAYKIANYFPGNVVIPMSATLIENEMKDLYTAMNVCNPIVFGSYGSFASKFLVIDHFNNVVGIKQIKVDMLKEVVDEHLIRRTLEEVWKERPPINQTIRHIEMVPKQKKLYEQSRDQKLSEIEEAAGGAELINQAQIAVLMSYLLQIADTAKAVTDDWKGPHSGKLEELKRMLKEEIPEDKPIVVFCRFAEKVVPIIVEELREMYGKKKIEFITGAVNQDTRAKRIKAFNKGKIKVLVCSDALAYGANLQTCNYMVNFDLPWNPAVLWQRIGRVYRRGQKKAVTIVNLFIKNTFEEHLYNLLKSKHELSKEILKESDMQKSMKNKDVNLKQLLKHL